MGRAAALVRLEGQESADVLPQELRERLVEIGPDGHVALAAGVGLGELLDHAVVLFERILLEPG